MTDTPGVGYILTDESITIYYGDIYVITAKAAKNNWDALISAVKTSRWGDAVRLIDVITAAKEFVHGTDIHIKDRRFMYKGEQLDNALSQRIIKMMDDDFDIKPMIRFLENTMMNPSYRAVTELYTFMSHCNLPITTDGYILAYKRVNADYTDCHTGRINNRPGEVPNMPRNSVDDNPGNTCSKGLHFCSLNYLRSFSGPRLLLLKIHPQDVVSIPNDYNGAKGRCCKYAVVKELRLDAFMGEDSADAQWKAVHDLTNTDPHILNLDDLDANDTEHTSGVPDDDDDYI